MAASHVMIFNPRMEAGARQGRALYQVPHRRVSRTPSPVASYAWAAGAQVKPGAPPETNGPRRTHAPNVLSTNPPSNVSKAREIAAPAAASPAFHHEQEVSTPRGAVTTPWRDTVDGAAPRGRLLGRHMSAPWTAASSEVLTLKLTDFVAPYRSHASEQEVTPRGAATTPFRAPEERAQQVFCSPCPPKGPQPAQTTNPRLWADILDDECADTEPKSESQGLPASQASSRGSVGHPLHCSDACKYALKKRGCKDGANCDHCHLCEWNRYVVRGRARAGNRQSATTPVASSESSETASAEAIEF